MAQRDDALTNANRIRFQRAALRAEVIEATPRREGRAILADAIETLPDWLASADALRVLSWAPGIAGELADVIFARTGSTRQKQLRELTPRQRAVMAEGLRLHGRPASRMAA